MSKEIIIKSPIKILTERSNCTQLNDGEIGIYQPPYRYKNPDGTLGDFKCKKVQIYTKINGEIRKTNTYKPTNFIHYKEMPMHPFPNEVYYTHAMAKYFNIDDLVDRTFTVEVPRFSDDFLQILFGFDRLPEPSAINYIIYKAFIQTIEEVPDYHSISKFQFDVNGKYITISLPDNLSVSFKFVIPLVKKNSITSFDKKNYFALIKTPFGYRISNVPKPKDKIPTMRRIKKTFFRLKKKYYTKNDNFIKFKALSGEVYRRYALDKNFAKKRDKRIGKYCSFYCKKKGNKFKKIHSLPNEYFVKRKGASMLPLNTKSPTA